LLINVAVVDVEDVVAVIAADKLASPAKAGIAVTSTAITA